MRVRMLPPAQLARKLLSSGALHKEMPTSMWLRLDSAFFLQARGRGGSMAFVSVKRWPASIQVTTCSRQRLRHCAAVHVVTMRPIAVNTRGPDQEVALDCHCHAPCSMNQQRDIPCCSSGARQQCCVDVVHGLGNAADLHLMHRRAGAVLVPDAHVLAVLDQLALDGLIVMQEILQALTVDIHRADAHNIVAAVTGCLQWQMCCRPCSWCKAPAGMTVASSSALACAPGQQQLQPLEQSESHFATLDQLAEVRTAKIW